MNDILALVIIGLSGIGIGLLIGIFVSLRSHKAGILVIDFTKPDVDRATIVMDVPLMDVSKKKWVSFKIRNKKRPTFISL